MKNIIEFNIDYIIAEYSNYVFKIVNNIAGKSLCYEDKEEIVSDTFYLLWKNQDRIESNLKAYLATIAKNCTYKKLKDSNMAIQFDEALDKSYSFDTDIDNLIFVKEKLKRLTKDEKIIFELYYVKGLKIREISSLLNKKLSSIKIKMFRIRKKLKEGFYNE